MPHRSLLKAGIIILGFGLIFLFVGCFDYEERVVFNDDFGGRVSFQYTVPLFPGQERSLLAFLPVKKEKIEEKYARSVRDYKVHFFEIEERESRFRRQARVEYKMAFQKPEELERLLIGAVTIRRRKNRLALERIFPVGKPLDRAAGRIEKEIRGLVLRSLEGHYLQLYIEYPDRFQAVFNGGALIRPGMQLLTFPLVDSMDKKEEFRWNMELTN